MEFQLNAFNDLDTLNMSFKDMSFNDVFDLDCASFNCPTQQGTPEKDQYYPVFNDQKAVLEYESSSSSYEPSAAPKRTLRRVSGEWSVDEDALLEILVGRSTKLNWPAIARQIHREVQDSPVRSASQCNQRWTRVLNPTIKKGKWSQEEDDMLVAAINSTTPRRWKAIADKIQGRTDIQVRYRLKAIGEKLVRQKLIGRECLPE